MDQKNCAYKESDQSQDLFLTVNLGEQHRPLTLEGPGWPSAIIKSGPPRPSRGIATSLRFD
jgi:hypothetical protein